MFHSPGILKLLVRSADFPTVAGWKADFQVPASGLMRNHFHLVFETLQGNLVVGMRWLLSA